MVGANLNSMILVFKYLVEYVGLIDILKPCKFDQSPFITAYTILAPSPNLWSAIHYILLY